MGFGVALRVFVCGMKTWFLNFGCRRLRWVTHWAALWQGCLLGHLHCFEHVGEVGDGPFPAVQNLLKHRPCQESNPQGKSDRPQRTGRHQEQGKGEGLFEGRTSQALP